MGGAKNCPETPRQKMISMMYLVLTAMLALNVSAQILNGYALVNDSMKKNIQISDGKLENLGNEFDGLLHSDSIKANKVKPRVDSVIAQSDAFCDYITELESKIITTIMGDKNATELDPSMNGDLNVASQIGLVDKPDGKNTNAAILKQKMIEYRDFMATIDTAKAKSIQSTFSTDDLSATEKGGKARPWESGVFEDMPAIATLTVLNKIKNDVKITQSEALAYLIGSMDAGDFRVNKIQALAIPNSSYIMRGGKYSAQIILAATDSTKKPVITINGTPLEKDRYEFVCSSVGTKKYSGSMVLTKKNGETQTYNFESEYTVGEPTATVSADLMNVLYAGFKNPISVSVPGVAQNSIEISPSNIKSSSRTSTGWVVVPAKVGTPCNISVSAKIDGKSQHIATKTFRVKKLPDPLAMIEYTNAQGIKSRYRGNSFDKAIAKPLLITARRIVAELNDSDLDVKYKVLEFSLNYFDSMGNTLIEKASGDQLNEKQLKIFREMTNRKTVYISNTKALGQDGISRTLPPLEVKIK
jgi:gliding motility-associated protein GldM